ncbi:hypothetical protein BV25DRAFT_1822031 [Artomyces pyxidatus]|uniref:Uncharacterized protein n=1 Tax=Artomyces pyxidatus TaxID=48021 RepID=A0ACB8TB70_9AGAM|nr:hypothetical protein BV25DRAFT_1822031 [Artomyces pyxidatus]
MYLSQSLTTLAPITSSSLAPSPRIRSLCAFAIYSWVPLGIVLLSASRTCEAAAPHAWADTRREVIYGGVTVLVVGALVILMVMVRVSFSFRACCGRADGYKGRFGTDAARGARRS